MNVSVHAAMGAVIALSVKQPIIALPLAFASHYLLDSFPHFGYRGRGGFEEAYKHRLTYFVVAWEVIALLLLILVLRKQSIWVFLAGFLAFAPDLVWFYRYYGFEKRGVKPNKMGKLSTMHAHIQWCERPWGIVIELGWFVLLFSALIRLVL